MLKQAGLQVINTIRYSKAVPLEKTAYISADYEAAASFFMTYSQPELESIIGVAIQKLEKEIENLEAQQASKKTGEGRKVTIEEKEIPERKIAIRSLKGLLHQHTRLVKAIKRMPRTAIAIMGIPAFIAVIFTCFLAYTDSVVDLLGEITIFAIVLSGIGFTIIVYFAYSTFISPEEE